MESGITRLKNGVYFATIPVDELAKKFGTPVFVFSEQRLIDNFKSLEAAFRKYYLNTFIYYSVKTNFELQILKTLHSLGSGAELASGLELEIAKKAGFKGNSLILDGPAWTDKEILQAIKENVSVLNVDSLDMMEKVSFIAQRSRKKVRVSFRINPEIKISLLKSFIEGYISKFGIPYSKSVAAYKKALSLGYVIPVSISTHIGSMITDPGYYEKAIDKLVNLAARLKEELNINIEEINIGGGFGVQSLNYYSIQNIILNKAGVSQYTKAASIGEFGERITRRFINQIRKYKLPEIRLILEAGRFIVSDAGILLTKVVSVKENWIFINGGINLIPESIFFIRRGFIIPKKLRNRINYKYNIAGPTLNTADVLATNQNLPQMKIGDLVIVLDAGAYSLSRSNQFTMLRPAAVYIDTGGKIKYLREGEMVDEVLNKLVE